MIADNSHSSISETDYLSQIISFYYFKAGKMEILVVLAILAIITWLFRFFGLKYYYHLRNIEEKEFLEKNEMSDDELIVILTAACESILNKSVIVRSIKFLQNPNDSAWSRMGKLHIMQSHYLR